MNNLENQEYNVFMGKLNLKIIEFKNDYQNLSEPNKKRFVQDFCVYLKQQGIIMTAQALYDIMAQRRQF